MEVIAYLQPRRRGGVGRHAERMVTGLARAKDINLRGLVSGPALRQAGSIPWIQGIQCTRHPFPETLLERSWKVLGFPPGDFFARGADWLYSPAEFRFPLSSIRTAITIHDIQAFETALPWSDTRDHHVMRRKWSMWLPKMMAEATRILTVSEFTKSRLINILNAPSDKISVIGNGVDEEFYRAGAAWIDCDRTDPSVVVVGGLRGKKGAGAVLSTAKILSSMNSPIHIDVIGQHESEWNARAAPHANVRLYGHLPTGKVAQMLAKSVALLFLSPYEGFGIPALEAMAAGAPAVVAARASLPEVVANAGILIDPDDAEDVARILERLRQEQEWRDSWVQAGKIHAAAFTWQACVSRLLVVLGASHLLQKP